MNTKEREPKAAIPEQISHEAVFSIELPGPESDNFIMKALAKILFVMLAGATGMGSSPASIVISSPAFSSGGKIPQKYTCDGSNVNPPLQIKGVPETAKSLALIMDDPDAPGGVWVHWLVWNVDPKTTEFSEKSVPRDASQGTTDFGDAKYGGPCPPSGTHRYFFKVYALDTTLALSGTSKKAALENAMSGHILAEGSLMGTYSRNK